MGASRVYKVFLLAVTASKGAMLNGSLDPATTRLAVTDLADSGSLKLPLGLFEMRCSGSGFVVVEF